MEQCEHQRNCSTPLRIAPHHTWAASLHTLQQLHFDPHNPPSQVDRPLRNNRQYQVGCKCWRCYIPNELHNSRRSALLASGISSLLPPHNDPPLPYLLYRGTGGTTVQGTIFGWDRTNGSSVRHKLHSRPVGVSDKHLSENTASRSPHHIAKHCICGTERIRYGARQYWLAETRPHLP